MDRYEKARAHKQSLERDIGLRNERLAQLKEEATQLEPVKQSDIDAFISLNQQENEIKIKLNLLQSKRILRINNVIKMNCKQILVGLKRIMT